jgi:GTP-binding protein EngB required for normal cell division
MKIDFESKWFIIFTGRPNAGKSSLLKHLTGLSVPSGKKPGTTKKISEIAIYSTPEPIGLIDLPGFGRIMGMKKELVENIKDYLIKFIEENHPQIILSVHVIDLNTFIKVSKNLERKGIIPIDEEMVKFLGEFNITTWIAANKLDRVKSREKMKILQEVGRLMPPYVDIYPISCRTGEGVVTLKRQMKKFIENRLGSRYSHAFLKHRL